MPDTDDDLTLSEVIEPVPELARALAAGMRGHDVARLQLDLKRGGIDPGPIDGIFGAKTDAAIGTFRERHALTGAGVGREVWAKVIEVAALERTRDLSRAAIELEERAAEHRDRANVLEGEAGPLREGGRWVGRRRCHGGGRGRPGSKRQVRGSWQPSFGSRPLIWGSPLSETMDGSPTLAGPGRPMWRG